MRYAFNLARHSGEPVSRMGIALILALLLFADLLLAWRHVWLRDELAKVDARQAALAAKARVERAESGPISRDEAEFRRVATGLIVEAAWDWNSFLSSLEKAKGNKIELLMLDASDAGKSGENVVKTVEIEGTAENMNELLFFLGRLKEIPDFRNVTIKESSRKSEIKNDPSTLVRYTIKAEAVR